jgi:opacity protein-like surface antigen
MIKTLTTALATIIGLALVLAATPSLAADSAKDADDKKSDKIVDNLYVAYSGGVSYIRNQNLTGADATGSDLNGRLSSDIGFNVGGAIGMRLYEHFRAELELGYHRAEADSLSVQGEPDNGQGYISLLSVMANGYVDYDLDIGVIPYVGVGIGWGRIELDAKNDNGILRIDGSDHVFTWSLMIGGSIPINEMMDLSMGYRYIATEDVDLNSSIVRSAGPPVAKAADRLDSEFASHEGVVSIRYKF